MCNTTSGNTFWFTHWATVALCFSLVVLVWKMPRCWSAESSVRRIEPIELINEQVRKVWTAYDLRPARPATDGEWCRRGFLDLLGRIPKVAELNAFRKDRTNDRRNQLVDRLLHAKQYQEEYTRHWTTIWTNWLIGRTGGTENDSLTNRAGLCSYLYESFKEDKPYHVLVKELITAQGTNTLGRDNFNGATNFLMMKLADNAAQATADTSRLFLGIQVQCTQCHDHPFNDWKQNQFWEMNAFFRQTAALRRFDKNGDIAFVELVNEDFAGEGGTPAEAEIYYERRNGDLQVAYPVFVDGTELKNHSGYTEDVIRREELTELIVGSTYFEKAIVNRMWGYFFGYGFTKPVDDMRPDNPPTHPVLLETLGTEFRARGFSLKQLNRWITLSEPYGLSSRMDSENDRDDPTLGEPPRFSHFYLRQMRAEQLYASLLTATQADLNSADAEQQETNRSAWLAQFNSAFGTDDGGETTTFNGTIPQSLMMMNGRLMKEATSVNPRSLLGKMAVSELTPSIKIEYLFMAGLSRKPTSREFRVANRLLNSYAAQQIITIGGRPNRRHNREATPDPHTAALQDIWWAILNSNEFILVH